MDHGLRQRCQHQLRRLQHAARRRLLVHAAVAWCATAGAVALALLVLLGLTDPPYWVRLGMLISGAALVLPLAWTLFVTAWRRTHSRATLARRLDRAGDFADTLAAAEEAVRRPDRWRTDTPVRVALVERLLARASRLSDDLDLPRVLPVSRPRLVFGAMALVIAAGFWLEASAPEVADRGWRHMKTAWRAPVAPSGAEDLRLAPAPDHVIAGASIAVAALDLQGGLEPVVCEVRAGSGLWRQVPARLVAHPGADVVLGAPFERWETVLADVQDDLAYRFRRAERQSVERTVAVWRPPLLARLAARIDPPAYTGLPQQMLDRLPAYVEVPLGSRLHLEGQSSQPLLAATVVTEPADTLLLTVDAGSLAGAMTLDEARRFRIHLRDTRGLAGRSELVYEVAVIPDRVPLVRLQRPDDDGHLPLTAPLVLVAAADDDYGLVGMDLLLRRGDADGGVWVADLPSGGRPVSDDDGWERVPLSGAGASGERDATTSLGRLPVRIAAREAVTDGGLLLDLELQPGALALVPGDVLELAVEARDNRVPGPPGVGRSAILRLQVPSSLELLKARDESGAGHRDDLAEMRRRNEALNADLERLRRELLKDPSPDWERRQELMAAVERQQELQAEMSRLADAMQHDLESLAESRLTSPEIMEKMDRIAQLMKEAQSGDMEQMLAKLQEQLEQMSSKEMSMTMEDLTRSQTEMMRRLDTAMSMLQDLAREQEMEGLTDLVAEMLSKQQELAEASRRAAAEDEDEAEAQEGEGDPGQEGQEGEDGEDGQEGGENEDGSEGESESGENQSGEQEDGAEADPGESEELARRQEALARELEEMEERLQETLEEMQKNSEGQEGEQSAAEQEMQKALEEALKQLEQQQTSETMDQAGENLKQEMSQEAAEQMQQALTDLAGLYHVMLRSQMAMQMAMQQEQAGQMRDLAADLLALSERQEQLGLDLPTNLRDVRIDELARRQHVILRGTMAVRDGLADVAGAAPQEVMRMLEQLDDLLVAQGRALNQLEDGRARGARQASDGSLAEMNRVVINLLTQAQMTGQGGASGSPQPMLSQQLRQMSEEQSGLNSMAEQLRQRQGRMSEEMRAGMKRLQQGQQGLAGQARRLAEEQEKLGGQHEGGRLLGDLDQLAQDMESVGDDLAGGLITEETVRRQERILSRLLDMHNASRERDWARRRESRSADDVYAEQDGATGPALDGDQVEARRWRPVDEAPPAYRDLVRDYFREVQKLHDAAGRDADGRRADPGGRP